LLYLVPPLVPEGEGGLEQVLANRPAVWPTAIVEWAVVATVLAWVVAVGVVLLRSRATAELPE
jgi:hypothetical protein